MDVCNSCISRYGPVCHAPFTSGSLPQVRSTVSDFAVFLTIVIMVLLDFVVGIPSPKLQVPHAFKVMGCFGRWGCHKVMPGQGRAESGGDAGGVTISSSTSKCLASSWKGEDGPKTRYLQEKYLEVLAKRRLALLKPTGEGDMKPGLGGALTQGGRGK